MRKESVLSLVFLSLIMLSTMMPSVSATDYTKVGVKVGDTADYIYSNPTANGTLATGRFRIHVLQIAGTNVTIDIRELPLNNSEGSSIKLTGDLAGDNGIQEYLVAANLGVGDNIVREDNIYFEWMRIDKTTTMLVAGQYRAVNHARYTGIIFGPMLRPGENFTYSNEAYYDKITGLLVETNITVTGGFSPYPNGTKASYIQMLTSTTAFNPLPPIQSTVALPVITAAIAVVAVIMVAAAIPQHRKQKTTTN